MRSAASLISLGLLVVAWGGDALAQAPSGPAAGSGASYEHRGRRDPFEPVEALDASMSSPTVATSRLKGIVRSQTPRVLVETPDGLGYILKVGDVLGEGRLVEIGADSAVFSIPARRGSPTGRIVLRLPED